VIAAIAVVACPRCSTASWATLPGLEGAFPTSLRLGTTSIAVLDSAARLTTAHFGHESVEFVLGSIADATLRTIAARTIVAPGLTNLAVRTVASHVTSLTTDTTDDASRVVLFLWAVVFAMTDFTAVLAGLVLVVSEGTVESGELTKLVTLEFVLTFGNRSSLMS
jgi:hypothetical protein